MKRTSLGRALSLSPAILVCLSALGTCGLLLASPQKSVDDVTVERVVAIGCEDCPGDAEGLAPVDLAIHDGLLWVLDRFEPFVRAFDMEGNSVRRYVTEGEGPAEAQSPYALHHAANGEVIVHGSLPATLLRVESEDGGHVSRTSLPLRVPLNEAFHAPTSTLYLLSFMFGEEGSRLDRIDVTTGESEPILEAGTEAFPGAEDAPLEQRARFALTALPSGEFVLGRAWPYELVRYSREGELIETFGREVPRPVDATDGAELPHFDRFGLQTDREQGRIWVRTYRGDLDRETIFDVFDASVVHVGEVSVPSPTQRDFASFAVEGQLVAVCHEDDRRGSIVSVWRVGE